MTCTKEDIERKRLAALQKRQMKLFQSNTPGCNPVTNNNGIGSPSRYSDSGRMRISGSSPQSFQPYPKPVSSKCLSAETLRNVNIVPPTKVISGTMYLITETRFEVNPSEFCSPLINIFKSIPSRSYNADSKLWNFSIDDHEDLINKVAPLAPYVVLGPLPPYVLKVLRDPVADPSQVDLTPIEATLRHKLMPFQQDGVRFGIARRGRCMIADDMGLGKTFQALAIASYYRHDWPLLIVTTSSMRDTWQSKIHELLPSLPFSSIVTLTTSKDTQLVADTQTEVVIVSYKIASMHAALLKNKKFGVIIIDESHHLKSPKAQCTASLAAVARGGARLVLLSGTPALSRPAELYTQLALLAPRLLPSYTDYGKRYCAGKQTSFGWDMSGQSNLTELQLLLQRRFLIRRTKEQLPVLLHEKTREAVVLDPSLLQASPQQCAGLSQLADAYRARGTNKQAALINLFSESAKVKIPAICKYMKQIIEEGTSEKFLVFAHHRAVIDAVCETLDQASVRYICIVGSTPPHARAELVERFQQAEWCRCGVLSVTAAGAGITLTAANLVVFAELHWNPGILTQAESRAHRIGQQAAVRVRYLLAAGTADDHMWPMLQGKLNVLNDVGLSKDSFNDASMKHQENKNKISQYLSPVQPPKNRNDYIPGTNIRKTSIESPSSREASSSNKKEMDAEGTRGQNETDIEYFCSKSEMDIDKSFLEDDEDDALLANLDL